MILKKDVLTTLKISMLLMITIILGFTFAMSVAQDKNSFFDVHFVLRAPFKEEYLEIFPDEAAKIGINMITEPAEGAAWGQRFTWGGETYEQGGTDLIQANFGIGRGYDPRNGADHNWASLGNMKWGDEMEESSVHFAWPNKGGLGDQLLRKAFAESDTDEAFKYMDVYNKWVYESSPVIFVLWLEEEEPLNADISGYIPKLGLRNTGWVTLDGKTVEDDTQIVIAQASDVASVSPMTIGDTHSGSIYHLSYGYLLYLDENFDIEPGLAKSWEVSEDGTEYTLHLHDVKWHDGTPFTSADVKWTYEFVAVDQTRPAYAYHFHYTIFREDIESITTPDEHTVVFKFNKPHGMGLNEFTRIPLMAKHRWEGISRDDIREHEYATNGPAMGLGPYRMVKWVKGQYIEFEANEDFYMGAPMVDKLFLKFIPERASALAALEAGEVDWLMNTYSMNIELDPIRDNPNFNIYTYDRGRSEGICINAEHPALSVNVRNALQFLMPREHIVENLRAGHGSPANQLCPPWNWGHSPDLPYYDFSLEKAQELMTEAGYDIALLEPDAPIPTTTYILPAIGGLLVGVVASLVFLKSRE